MIKTITVVVPEEVHYSFKNKCKFNDMTIQYVLEKLTKRFSKTEELDYIFKENIFKIT